MPTKTNLLPIVLFFIFFTLSSGGLNRSVKPTTSQIIIDEGRQLLRFKYALKDLNNLPYSDTEFSSEVIPHIRSKNEELASHLMLEEYRFTEQNKVVIASWISSYPDEFESFIRFLETFNRSHF